MKLNYRFFVVLCFMVISCHRIQGWPWGSNSNTTEQPLEVSEEKLDPSSLHKIEEDEILEPYSGMNHVADGDSGEQNPPSIYNDGSVQQGPQYDTQPQQSPFLEPGAHPTQSQGADPRFQAPRNCVDGQYMCRKASTFQEHIRCIPNEWKCNGVRDCEENDDEEGCAINPHQVQPQCMAHQHTCYGTGINGIPAQCINRLQVCDGVYDCSYGDDENNCAARAADKHQQSGEASSQDTSATQPGYGSSPQTQSAPANQQGYASGYGQQFVARQPSQSECSGRSEEYVKRLEWLDRCYRSCMRHQH